MRVSIAAASSGLDPQDVAPSERVAVRQGSQDTLLRGAWIENGTPGAARHATGNSPWWIGHAVNADGHHGFFGKDLVLAHHPAAAALPACAPAVLDHPIGPQTDRITNLEELDGVVLLRHEIDRVDAVGLGARAVTDTEAVGEQEAIERSGVGAICPAHDGNDVGRVRGRRAAIGCVDETVERGQNTHHGQAAHSQRCGKTRPQQ